MRSCAPPSASAGWSRSTSSATPRSTMAMGRASTHTCQRRGGCRPARSHDRLLAGLARAGGHPRPRAWATDPALRVGDHGTHVHAGRRTGCGAHPSLPETPGGGRNWDYRYTRIRDSTFLLRAFHYPHSIGRRTSSCSSWPTSTATTTQPSGSSIGPMVAEICPNRCARTCRGYIGARLVRVGNGAFDHQQNDVTGAAFDMILLHGNHSQRVPRRLCPPVQAHAECASAVCRQLTRASGKPGASRGTTSRQS